MGTPMNSRDIEARIADLEALLTDLHNELVEAGDTAWIHVPCVSVQAGPDTNEVDLHVMLGHMAKRD